METDKDAIAAGCVAIAGVVAICNELANAGLLGKNAFGRIMEFMVAATEASELQAHLHEAFVHHFVALRANLPPDT